MNEILQFILTYCSFLYAGERYGYGRYRFVDSRVGASFGGDAYLVLESEAMRMQFVRDRGELTLYFQGTSPKARKRWFGLGVVRPLITGERVDSAVLNQSHAEFLSTHLEKIEALFTESNLANTIDALNGQERARAKELFG